jgi:mono/diheme cytochrome c family protein
MGDKFIPLLVSWLFLSSAVAQNTSYSPDPDWKAPSSAAAKKNPLASKPQAAQGGKKLFLRNCAECHGEAGGGVEKKHSADFQLPAVQAETDGELFWKITNGNVDKGMPPFSGLPEMQRWQIVLYLRTLKK